MWVEAHGEQREQQGGWYWQEGNEVGYWKRVNMALRGRIRRMVWSTRLIIVIVLMLVMLDNEAGFVTMLGMVPRFDSDVDIGIGHGILRMKMMKKIVYNSVSVLMSMIVMVYV